MPHATKTANMVCDVDIMRLSDYSTSAKQSNKAQVILQ